MDAMLTTMLTLESKAAKNRNIQAGEWLERMNEGLKKIADDTWKKEEKK